MPSKDKAKLRAAQKRYREKNRDAINARSRARYHANVERSRARQRDYRRRHYDAVLTYNRKWHAAYRKRLRAEFVDEYGGRCACCGESEPLFLQLDHVENDGAEERRVVKTSAHFLARLKRLGWPKDRYQLLCANCNFGKMMNGGTCPHASDQ